MAGPNTDFGSQAGAAQTATKTVQAGKYLAVWDVSVGVGAVALQMLFSAANWVTIASKTADGIQEINLPHGDYRVDVAGATTGQVKLYKLVI